MADDISLLDHVKIASPCDVGWENMRGDDRVRFCDACEMNVYNLSALRRTEAEELIRRHEGRLCVSLYRRADGTILTADCPVGASVARRSAWRVAAGAACVMGFLIAGASLLGLPDRTTRRLRDVEPFSRVCRWLAPPPPAVAVPVGSPAPLPALGVRYDGILMP